MDQATLKNGLSDEQFKEPKIKKEKLFKRRPARDLIYLRKLMKIVSTAIDTDIRTTI